jgi:hypothetical protein
MMDFTSNGCKEQMGVDTIKGANKITLQKDCESRLIFLHFSI